MMVIRPQRSIGIKPDRRLRHGKAVSAHPLHQRRGDDVDQLPLLRDSRALCNSHDSHAAKESIMMSSPRSASSSGPMNPATAGASSAANPDAAPKLLNVTAVSATDAIPDAAAAASSATSSTPTMS